MFSIIRSGLIAAQVAAVVYPKIIASNVITTVSTHVSTQNKLVKDSTGRLWATYFKQDVVTAGDKQIFVAYSDDNGATWTEEQVTNSASQVNQYPAIAVDSSNNIHLVWQATGWGTYSSYSQIIYRKRTTSWQTAEQVTDINHANGQYMPAISVDSSGYVHVVWYGYGLSGTYPAIPQIGYRKRTTSWQTVELVTDNEYGNNTTSITTDSSNNVHVCYVRQGVGSYTSRMQLSYRKRTTSWQTEEQITNVDYDQANSDIVVDSSGYVHVVWQGKGYGTNASSRNIMYCKRTTSWGSVENVTDLAEVAGGQYYPTLKVDTNGVHVVWQGHGLGTNTTIGNIYFSKRVSSSSDWANNRTLITDLANIQNMPNMIRDASSNNPAFVYCGNNGSQNNVYFYTS